MQFRLSGVHVDMPEKMLSTKLVIWLCELESKCLAKNCVAQSLTWVNFTFLFFPNPKTFSEME